MPEKVYVKVEGGTGGRRGWSRYVLMLPGLGCIGIGVLALVLPPRVTATIVAVFFFIVGAGLLSVATRVRRRWDRNTGGIGRGG